MTKMYFTADITCVFTHHEEDGGNIDAVSRKSVFPGQLPHCSLKIEKEK